MDEVHHLLGEVQGQLQVIRRILDETSRFSAANHATPSWDPLLKENRETHATIGKHGTFRIRLVDIQMELMGVSFLWIPKEGGGPCGFPFKPRRRGTLKKPTDPHFGAAMPTFELPDGALQEAPHFSV